MIYRYLNIWRFVDVEPHYGLFKFFIVPYVFG